MYPLAAGLLALGAILLLGRLVKPKYASGILEGGLTEAYYLHAEEGHQVLFIGDCEVYECFSPVTLFNEYGVTSYIRGSAQQLIWQSYYILKDTLRYETPRVVVLSVCSMRYSDPQKEAYNRMTLEGLKPSFAKLQAVEASKTEGESTLSYFLPLLRYHSRLGELTKEDWQYLFKKADLSANGYLMRCDVEPLTRLPATPPLKETDFSEGCYGYLDKIVALCREKGVELILVKSPCLYPAWYDAYDEALEKYAAKAGATYINALKAVDEIGLDFSEDTYDGGLHLNVYGAEKYTRWFGKKLLATASLSDQRQEEAAAALWQQKTEAYEQEKKRQLQEIKEYGCLISREVLNP